MLLTNCMIKRSCKSKETASDGLEKERAAQLNLQERRLCWPCEEPEKGNKISFSSVSDAVELWKILHKERSGLILPCLLILLVSVRTVSYPPVNYFLFSKMFLFKIQFV
nr:uncharacterized protein LOC110362295 isoform X3 [Columba livia]